MNHIKPCDIYGRTTQRYRIKHLIVKTDWIGNKKVTSAYFEFNDKSSWTKAQASRIIAFLKTQGEYFALTMEPVS